MKENFAALRNQIKSDFENNHSSPRTLSHDVFGLLEANLDADALSKFRAKYQRVSLPEQASKKEIVLRLIEFVSFAYQYEKSLEPSEIKGGSSLSKRNENGIFYTDIRLAQKLVEDLFSDIHTESISEISTKTFLEPCAGIGSFVFAYLFHISDKLEGRNDREEILFKVFERVYVVDNDPEAIDIYRRLLPLVMRNYCGLEPRGDALKQNSSSLGLVYSLRDGLIKRQRIADVFPQLTSFGGFDFILTNPPYVTLKMDSRKFADKKDYTVKKRQISELVAFFKRNPEFRNSSIGIINIYRIFVEEIFERLTKVDSRIGLVIPGNILADKSSDNLRQLVFSNHVCERLYLIPESNDFFHGMSQALVAFTIKKSPGNGTMKIFPQVSVADELSSDSFVLWDLKENENAAILTIDMTEKQILEKVSRFSQLKDFPEIENLRGELDLSMDRNFIQEKETDYELIRGNSIGSFFLKSTKRSKEFVDFDNFRVGRRKSESVTRERIACQQIVNIHKQERVAFCFVPKGKVLGNSCNYLQVKPNLFGFTLYKLLAFLNSSLINWRFKLTSSNNHINNYEIAQLPLPDPSKYAEEFNRLEKHSLEVLERTELVEEAKIEIDGIVSEIFELSDEETIHLLFKVGKTVDYIIKVLYSKNFPKRINQEIARLEDKLKKVNSTDGEFALLEESIRNHKLIADNNVLNHETAKLSDLDMEMVRSVTPGGNWKEIPDHIAKKSKRVSRIKETGGRTTLYGRLEPGKPSYTVSTFFSRPGNGTFIHYDYSNGDKESGQDRLISFREAARLQSFPDSYRFYGSKTSLYKQIGNAVPPLLAYALGKKLKAFNYKSAVDLFCGAGGLSEGLINAGITVVAANDNFNEACLTYSHNHLKTKLIEGDITDSKVKQALFAHVVGDIDIVCGGPPCQGFSHAGKRMIDDPRNQLFKEFVEVVKKLKPKIFVMENVEGILSINSGKTYKSIVDQFKEVGYHVEGKKLRAAEFGVPQRRKRVFIIGTSESIDQRPMDFFPEGMFGNGIFGNLNEVTVKEAISDLPIISMGGGAREMRGQAKHNWSAYQLLMKNLIAFEDFMKLKKLEQA